MNRFLTMIVVLAALGGVVLAEDAPKPTDLCNGAVDPYDWVTQKGLFFKAAGKDNELTDKEFATDKEKSDGFVRFFEKWETIAAFDKDGNKTADWLEADAYRRNLRKRVLTAHDANKDGKLTGDERTAANKALAEGKFATAPTRTDSSRSRASYWGRPETIKQYDKNGDGKLSETEQQAARAAWRQRSDMRRFDTNKDGKLDGKEQSARDKANADAEKRRKEFYNRFDRNKDGKIDEKERGAVGEYYRNRRFDQNNDGKLDKKETAARDKANAEREKRIAETRKRFDKNGDGKLNEAEGKALRDYYRSRSRRGQGRGGSR